MSFIDIYFPGQGEGPPHVNFERAAKSSFCRIVGASFIATTRHGPFGFFCLCAYFCVQSWFSEGVPVRKDFTFPLATTARPKAKSIAGRDRERVIRKAG